MRSDGNANQKGDKQQQASGSSQPYLPSYYQLATAPSIPRTRIDATDRRQIEAQNEDKSHTTKETLDDIKRVHRKEKKKKEQKATNHGIFLERPVSSKLIYQYEISL